MAYKIVNNMLPTSKYSIKAPYAMNPLYITVHNTGNTASARNEAAYHNSNNAQVSYHVAIDDKEAVQLIPFNRTAWHAGDGMGNGNMRSIGIEICHSMDNGYSGAKSARYKAAEENAALYIAYVLKQYGWGMDRLKRHYDWSGKDCPHKMHATNSYQAFRNRVKAHLNALNSNASKPAKQPVAKPKPAKKPASSKKSTATIVNEVIAGKWGTGNARFNALRKAGYNPTTIQNAVNKKLGASPSKPAKKSIDTVAREVIAGKWGNGNARFNSLRKAGYNPDTVQRRVNQLL
ncbi:N-acetylmuramoyl-L-alanine amidase [Jeotgalicoccus aerolatus]|uniref:N-acetylmuramoyl-L-alanine amidase n=1 Tax=Jeotgalicoccus aerolatus TaxID=709510 RepID=A0A1G9BX80_9STAP|nr:N-acetylmuramoyl-L-alanine amidase [Jeotgalicoccus aerolatus]SDK44071.1 N-acetylmuramoyl-L-alanine amidase [Jeotgalicoccus aerolatus]